MDKLEEVFKLVAWVFLLLDMFLVAFILTHLSYALVIGDLQ